MTKRIISAIIMVAVILPFVIYGKLPFAIMMSVLAVAGLYELLHIRESKKEFPKIMKYIAYVLVVFFTMINSSSNDFQYDISYKVVSLIIFMFVIPMVFINDTKKYNLNDALFLVGSILFVGLSFNLLMVTRNISITYFIYLFLITIVTDTFALFTGMLVGKHKLAPEISPKKTIEGAVGGSLMGTFVASAFYTTVINPATPLVIVILLTLLLTVVGQIGDLAFSSIKRYYGVKDFSNLIPGHGGILDRFDSVVFVTMAFVIIFGII